MRRAEAATAGLGCSKRCLHEFGFDQSYDIRAEIEPVPSDQTYKALDRLEQGDVRHRFVIDATTLSA